MWSLLGPIWSVKYLNFSAKATDSDRSLHLLWLHFLYSCRSQIPIYEGSSAKDEIFVLGLSKVTFYNAILKTGQQYKKVWTGVKKFIASLIPTTLTGLISMSTKFHG